VLSKKKGFRILVVGLGSIGKRHLSIIRILRPDADIRVIRHKSCTEIPKFANGCFDSFQEAVEFLPQAAVIANPSPFHLSISKILANIGCHLLIEKPLSNNANDISDLIKIRNQNNLIAHVGYNLRRDSTLVRFKKEVVSGLVGRILSVRCEAGHYLPSWRPNSDYRLGVSARADLGGGVLSELSHELDYLRWIFGEISSVSARLDKQSDLEVDVEDSAHFHLRLVSDSGNFVTASVNLDFIRHDRRRVCFAIGERGTLKWDGIKGCVELWKEESKNWETLYNFQHSRNDTYIQQWLDFLNCIDKDKNKIELSSLEDGLAIMKVIDSIRESNSRNSLEILVN